MEPIIEVKNLEKFYKKRKSKECVKAVNDISFHVNKGEIMGLLGPNGAGKSTTIKMICGLLIPDAGDITVNGLDTRKNRLESLNHISAVLEGNRNLYWRLTVRENLEYFAGNRGASRKEVAVRIEELLADFNLKSKEKELVNRLSRGMQQKLAIAVALLAESDVILLDEPTLGLDVETGYEVRDLLRGVVDKYNRTIIISTHDMDVVQDLCERTVIINNGEVITDDRVENLLRLFDIRSYTIQLGALLTEKQQLELTENFVHHAYIPDTYQSIIEIDLTKSEQIYDLFDVLKTENTPVESIDRGTINFEQIFMKLVKGEETNEMAQSS
ncbi:MAG TPA: ABC transporter ATP-binding protein [Virgibacillus sp.]|nr:ABC transporter ATP-binding protein [Virgibacillus sp.]